MGVQALFNFTPLPKSKSQIFTGDTYKHKYKFYYNSTPLDLKHSTNSDVFKLVMT